LEARSGLHVYSESLGP